MDARFFHLRFADHDEEHGLGIGLYNCAWRIRLLGGRYAMEPNPAGGAVFWFSVPLRFATTTPLAHPVYAFMVKVLVIDNTPWRHAFVRQLSQMGVASVDATVNPAWVTPEEAMAMAKPRVEPPQATAGTKGNGRVAMFAARNELAVAAANGPATTTPTNTQE